jgi:hypothetical protein
MKPFRTSLSARIISASISWSLIGAGLIALTGMSAGAALPIVLLMSIGGCLVGLVLGVHDHTGPVALLAILLPLILWPYAMAVTWAVDRGTRYGAPLLAVGAVILGLNLIASLVPERRPRPETLATSER